MAHTPALETSLNMTSFAGALKQHYTQERIENMVYKDNPFLAMISKYENFGGENLKLPIKYGIPQGRSATFADAQHNKTSTQLKAFLLTRVSDYSLASIANETIEASKGNANAFMEAATVEIDGAIESATRSLAISLFGDGSGQIGVVGSLATTTASNDTITLATIDDVTNFEIGMQLNFGTATNNKEVISVNRDTGVVIVNAASGATATEAIYIDGDKDAKLSGLGAWLPSSAPGSTAFFGVDRSVDSTRLGGIRFSGSSLPLEEALIGAAARVAREGGKPDVCFMNYSNFADLEKALGSKVSYVDVKVSPEIGFRGVLIHGPRGPIKVVPDQNCPKDVAYMLQMDVWKLYSLGKAPKILDSDGLKFLRDSTADSVEVRVGYYAQLGCRGPGYNVRIAL
tara:strand:+ start:3478 stop:4677 length:1200 start_codon:yes stop_codon:yes gene_type:complete